MRVFRVRLTHVRVEIAEPYDYRGVGEAPG